MAKTTTTEIVEEPKRGRGRPRLSPEEKKERAVMRANGELPSVERPDRTIQAEPGDNAKYLRHALKTMGLPPIDISDAKQVEDRINWYFVHCAEDDMKPTVNGMCNALGIHRDTILTWRKGEYRADSHQAIIVRAHRVLEELWEDYMQNGKINPVSGIFLGKNLFGGYSDKQEVVLTPNTPGLSSADVATIEAKYAELPDVED
jgi:hypothetical protein